MAVYSQKPAILDDSDQKIRESKAFHGGNTESRFFIFHFVEAGIRRLTAEIHCLRRPALLPGYELDPKSLNRRYPAQETAIDV